MTKIRNLISDLLFWGYARDEYSIKNNVELKGAINAFKTQISFMTVFSLIVSVTDLIGVFCAVAFMNQDEFLRATHLHIEIIMAILALGLTVGSVFSKVASIMLCTIYLSAGILLLLYGNVASLLLCILCFMGYVRIVFVHEHLKYANKYLNDDISEINNIIKGTTEMREQVKKVFKEYERGGTNPLNNQINHEAVFNKPLETDVIENKDEIHVNFSEEELDTLFGQNIVGLSDNMFETAE